MRSCYEVLQTPDEPGWRGDPWSEEAEAATATSKPDSTAGMCSTICAKMITVLTRYRPIVFESICSRNDCNFPRRRFFFDLI